MNATEILQRNHAWLEAHAGTNWLEYIKREEYNRTHKEAIEHEETHEYAQIEHEHV